MRKGRFLLFLFLAVVVGGGIFVFNGSTGKKETKALSSFGVIDEAYAIIQEKAVYPVKDEELVEGALRGMADAIGDRYSTYFTKEEAAAHRESLASERVGIGAEITRTNGKFIIVAPVKSSPADQAGLQPYDEIIRIDDEDVDADTLQEVVKRIRGKQGTTLKMTVYRPELNKHLEMTITRDAIPVATVSSEMIAEKDRKVGYIAITTFGEDTAAEWKTATDAVIEQQAEAIIIDLRGNPGGYLHSVSEVAGSMLAEDTVFSYMENPEGALTPLVVEKSEKLDFNEQLKRIPVVVLQDKGSASASEVLSGALKELKRGIVIGTQSFGKGTVQDTTKLSNGGEIKLSTHKWLTPKENWIHGVGVEADLDVQQNALFNEHIQLITAEYAAGDYHEEIAYAQRLLAHLGHEVGREDGYYDKATGSAVKDFRKEAKIAGKAKMDREFFAALKEKVETYRADYQNDIQLKMAIDYLAHEAKK